MKRAQIFRSSVSNPTYINDSRFGLRKLFLNEQERPTIALYTNPGRGASGESQT
jgi:hypothetical protein